jgi:hypothetical protein
MTPEEAYEETLRRIREAEKTGAVELDLSGLGTLNRLPQELASLTSLQELDLRSCWVLTDLSPLRGLMSLRALKLSYYRQQLSYLYPLAGAKVPPKAQPLQLRSAHRLKSAGRRGGRDRGVFPEGG